uniref:Lymphocyte antigen 6E-like n=1 Tax=Nothoprocta perdicaria TaxID=30464 RepID=A0A8C7A3F7_NOTPE
MRTTLALLLTAVICVEQAYAFMCYVCQKEESNKNCLTISMCSKEDKYCVTVRNDIGTSTLQKTLLSRIEVPVTGPGSQGQCLYNVTCCEKPLCNVNGASSKQNSYAVMSLGILATIAYIFTPGL